MDLTSRQYDILEDAIAKQRRIAVMRRGTEFIFVPQALRLVEGREALDGWHPTTGDRLRLFIDELDHIALVA